MGDSIFESPIFPGFLLTFIITQRGEFIRKFSVKRLRKLVTLSTSRDSPPVPAEGVAQFATDYAAAVGEVKNFDKCGEIV